jgi:hypothetical protein
VLVFAIRGDVCAEVVEVHLFRVAGLPQ